MQMNTNHEKVLTVLHIWIWTRHNCPGSVRSHFEFCAPVPVFIEYKLICHVYWNKNFFPSLLLRTLKTKITYLQPMKLAPYPHVFLLQLFPIRLFLL